MIPTVVIGGDTDQINVIPAWAVVCLDIRTMPGVDHVELNGWITELAGTCGESAGVTATVEVVDDRPAVDTPPATR